MIGFGVRGLAVPRDRPETGSFAAVFSITPNELFLNKLFENSAHIKQDNRKIRKTYS
jgi:hypothetical protein